MKNPMIFVFCVLCLGVNAFGQYDEAARKALDQMSETYQKIPSFQANLSYEMNNKTDEVHEAYNGKISVKGDMYRLEMQDQEIFNDGKTVWTYIPGDNPEVNIDNHDPDGGDITPSSIYSIYKQGYKYILLKKLTFQGKKYNVIDLVPNDKDSQYYKIRLQVGQSDHLLRKFVLFDKEGSEFSYTISKFNSKANLQDNFFRFDTDKHKGVEVIDLR